MPILKVTLTVGSTDAQKLALFQSLTAAVQRAVQAPPENIRIILNEIPRADWWHTAVTPPPSRISLSEPQTAAENK
ncbi:tautomerase family protein [Acidovorax carolinensis]|uniref:tautomerase family protein n=1 Tax=Acidovorax carolinensis TaxID=553814 RepID=UPI000B3423EA|nr:tautomerase family protein [Acidovorax carolinensis]ART49555.1 hypothetical protein CBP33_16700 [Acidovorax carolinensis]